MDQAAALEALQAIGQTLLGLTPASSRGAHLRVHTAGDYAGFDFWTIEQDGTESVLRTRPRGDFYDDLDDLRRATATPGGGAWYTADITVVRGGEVSARYDYDNQPDLHDPEPSSQTYVDDLREFPRTDENTPDWLQRHIRAASD
jgi:hypothetical protein